MIDVLAWLLAIVLGSIAVLHAYWANGGKWPAADESGLIRTVFGDQVRHRLPPPWTIWLVAGLIAVTAVWPLLLVQAIAAPLPRFIVPGMGAALAAIFLLRGVAGYLPGWRRAHALEPFASLDIRLYSPLCFLIGGGFAALVMRSRF